MKRQSAIVVTLTCLLSVNSFGADKDDRPAELKVLERYVGTWAHEATLLPTKSSPKKTTRRAIEQTEWMLSDSFLISRAVNETDGLKSLSFFTVNRNDRTTYPFWYFGSSGGIGHLKGKWDEASKTMTFSSPNLPPDWKGAVTHKFSDDSYNSTMKFTNDAGETVMDRHDLRKRQGGIAGKNMLESWAKIGTPIEPIPDEMKKLEPLIGTWDAKYVFRLPQRREEKGVITDEWALDGRFVLRREAVGDSHSIAMIGYDTNKKAYRLVRAVSNGRTNELMGEWNDDTRSIIWKAADTPKGVTSISTWRFVGNDAVQLHVVGESESGVTLDLTIKTERRKKK
jgi:hypothetical protein